MAVLSVLTRPPSAVQAVEEAVASAEDVEAAMVVAVEGMEAVVVTAEVVATVSAFDPQWPSYLIRSDGGGGGYDRSGGGGGYDRSNGGGGKSLTPYIDRPA